MEEEEEEARNIQVLLCDAQGTHLLSYATKHGLSTRRDMVENKVDDMMDDMVDNMVAKKSHLPRKWFFLASGQGGGQIMILAGFFPLWTI